MPTKAFERLQPEKKRKIIDAALIEFSENTVDNAGVNSIAKRAGISRTTLYYYFSDINDIFSVVIDEIMMKFKENMFVNGDDQIDIFEGFYNYFVYVASYKGSEYENFICRILREMSVHIRNIITEPYIRYYTANTSQVKNLNKIKYSTPRELYDILFMIFSVVNSALLYYFVLDVPYEKVERRVKNGLKVVKFGAIKEEYRNEELGNE